MTSVENIDILARGVLFYSTARLINTDSNQTGSDTIADIENYVKLNFADPKLSLQSLSERFGYNIKYLSKLFLQHTGVKYSDYISTLRITSACALLSDGGGKIPIKDAAYRCGFRDALYFSRVFKKYYGVSPTDYAKNNK